MLCVTAVSPSLAPEELADCRRLAAEWGLRWVEVATDELADPAYTANDGARCYHCKASLLEALDPILASEALGAETVRSGHSGAPTVVLGVNVDDLGDHRPGQRAAAERGAVFPLVEAGFTKDDVRRWSRRLGLRTWDKPAAACLASRVPYGTAVTLGTLRSVADAESGLRALGFRQLRVRHYGDTARIEVARRGPGPGGGAARPGDGGRPRGRLPVRDPRPRRVPLREPERRPGRRRTPPGARPGAPDDRGPGAS